MPLNFYSLHFYSFTFYEYFSQNTLRKESLWRKN